MVTVSSHTFSSYGVGVSIYMQVPSDLHLSLAKGTIVPVVDACHRVSRVTQCRGYTTKETIVPVVDECHRVSRVTQCKHSLFVCVRSPQSGQHTRWGLSAVSTDLGLCAHTLPQLSPTLEYLLVEFEGRIF